VSLVGIDVGSSAVKAAAYRETGTLLARSSEPAPSLHPAPGLWESDANEVWGAVVRAVRRLAAEPALRGDPPVALAVSASGRESFPARADGTALGMCLRTADARRPRRAATEIIRLSREQWVRACGHVPDHMDPTSRLLWWHETDPRTMDRARWFLGWHELISLTLSGRPIVDPALAAGFLIFDRTALDWSRGRVGALGIDGRVLPDVVAWGTDVGRVRAKAAAELGLPASCRFVVGSWDGSCAAVGAGAVEEGDALVAAGTWESVVAPVSRPRIREAARLRLAVTPQPSVPGTGLWARSPNGASALDWALHTSGVTLRRLERALVDSGTEPTRALVVPHLSGAPAPWPEAPHASGAILGISLATSPVELVKGMLEGIALELRLQIEALRFAGAPIDRCKVAGGGARSHWWMQLKADLLGIPVEVPKQDEPGTFGAALLAGVGLGTYSSFTEAARSVAMARRFEPDAARADAFRAKIERHREAAAMLLAAGAVTGAGDTREERT
jgi:xylulokinase